MGILPKDSKCLSYLEVRYAYGSTIYHVSGSKSNWWRNWHLNSKSVADKVWRHGTVQQLQPKHFRTSSGNLRKLPHSKSSHYTVFYTLLLYALLSHLVGQLHDDVVLSNHSLLVEVHLLTQGRHFTPLGTGEWEMEYRNLLNSYHQELMNRQSYVMHVVTSKNKTRHQGN